MKTITHRISNVLAWAGFLTVSFLLLVLFYIVLSAAITHLQGVSKIPAEPEACPDCRIITQDDINHSATLRNLNAYAGDMISEDSYLIQVRKSRYDAFKRDASLMIYFHDPIVQLLWLFWLITGLVNYVIVGSFRILPWRVLNDRA